MQLIVTLIVVVIFAIFTLSSAQYMSGNNGWETVATNNAGVIDASKFAVDWYVQGGDAQFLVVDATKQWYTGLKFDLTVGINRPSIDTCTVNHFVVAVNAAGEKTVTQNEMLADNCSMVNGFSNRNGKKRQNDEGSSNHLRR